MNETVTSSVSQTPLVYKSRAWADSCIDFARIRKETGWIYTKIVQAMRRLGKHISRLSLKKVIVDAGLGPQLHDHLDACCDFIKRHPATLWQCDFACEKKRTIKDMVDVYFHVFVGIGNRRI